MTQYWYNVRTHQVEEDAMSDWTQLLGPYETRDEAEHALEKVKERNRSWDPDDANGDGWSDRD
ncbi:SPOR domain-containing protein [Sinomonas susongensis]|uniref:SPOR domain-containing protein n=1 Tax=Sinomonas susongensis TaxID=1324851 RepID=UPI001108F371|nr:SPOR domain-containing protein [Sinomonas susongensis]